MSLRMLSVLALAAMCVAQGPAHASQKRAGDRAAASEAVAVDDAKVDRLTDLVVEMTPIGKVLELVAGVDPKWPMQDSPDAVTDTQLACLRTEMNGDAYRRHKRREVADYVAKYPLRVDTEIEALGQGAAKYSGQLVLAGARSEVSGGEVNVAGILAEATPGEMRAFLEVVNGSDYQALRELSGMNAILDAGKAKPNDEHAATGLASLMVPLMLRAMDTCKVPMSALPE